MQQFLLGGMAVLCLVAALFFFRFWRETSDRLFIIFSASFFLLGLTRLGLTIARDPTEGETSLYWVRLLAFLLICVAIIDKNRR
jgi:hypothetical protein